MRWALAVTAAMLLLMMGTLFGVEPTSETETCSVRLSLVDAESEETIPGLVRVKGAAGQTISLPGVLPRGQGLDDQPAIQEWSALVRPETVRFPREVLEFSAFSGIETEITTQTVDLRDKAKAEITLKLHRFYDARHAGLQNANTHVHVRRLTRPETDRYLIESSTADGLDLVFVSYLERADDDVDYISNKYTRDELHALNTDHVHFDNGEEHRHNFNSGGEGFGHVMLLSIPELVYPVSIGPGISKTGTDGIPLQRGIERAREMGGTVIWCHNAWGLEDIPDWLAGRLHANNIFDGGSRGSYAHSFYRYWNVGIPVPVSTGTDWFIYDFSRVYVPAPDQITPEQWLDQLAVGHSYITNGPLLEFTVNGQGIGEPIEIKEPGDVTIVGRAVGRVDFERLELVRNGEVIESISTQPEGEHFVATMNVTLPIDGPCWVALRTPPPSAPIDPDMSTKTPLNEYGRELFSHTSATFIDVGNRRVFDHEVASSLIKDMQDSQTFIGDRGTFADDSERQAVLSVYDQGIAAMQERIADHPAD